MRYDHETRQYTHHVRVNVGWCVYVLSRHGMMKFDYLVKEIDAGFVSRSENGAFA
jgi:hypothetical protein